VTSKPRPVDIYVRVSRVGRREHLQSPADQEREARSFAASRGLPVGEVFTDLDQSGGTLDRPALQAALRRVEQKASAGIVAAYLSRASRDTVQGLTLLDEITEKGGAVYAPNLTDYTTADGKMLTTIQLAVDTGYRESLTSPPYADRRALWGRDHERERPAPSPPASRVRAATPAPASRPAGDEPGTRASGTRPSSSGDRLDRRAAHRRPGSTLIHHSKLRRRVAAVQLDDVQPLIDAPSPAVLTTYRRDGSALTTPVWFRFHDGAFEVVLADGDVKRQHLDRTPACLLVVFEVTPPFRAIEVRGDAELVECDVTEAREAIAGRYLGVERGRRFAASRRSPRGTVVRLVPHDPRVWDLSAALPE